MGVRGLTSFIARHAELYLTPYELHDCNLVIDGDNLACNLYKDVTGTYSAFGGDYDDFFRGILNFFQVMAECNVHCIVLMDGGYEQRKLRTVAKRLRGKIAIIKRINPCGSIPVFPVFMKEVFVDAVRAAGVPVMRCVFEADDELAALGRKLNCPVLSYDSDFYIHNVRYIPLITLTVKAHTKHVKEEEIQEQPTRKLRKNEVKHMEKLTKANRIMGDIQVNNVEKMCGKKGKTYKYLDCCMYRIENLITRRSLSKEKLPLFAALLGNDYIARSSFRNLFKAGLGKVGRSRKMKQQQKRIRVIIEWLKHETLESALEKMLSKLRKNQRESLLAQVQDAISGYSNEMCHSYDFLKEYYEKSLHEFPSCSDDDEMNEVETEETENEEEEQQGKAQEIESDEEEEIEDDEEEIEEDEEEIEEDSDADDEDVPDKTKEFPAWFLEKLYPAHLSRYFVDLMHLRKYINSPQIEHFPHNDCHEIALPILIYIFTLLNSADGEETQPKLNEDGTDMPIEFTYMARAPRVTNIRYTHYAIDKRPKYIFNPRAPNPMLFRSIFEEKMPHLNIEELFEKVSILPKDLQLYFLGIIYWLQKSQHCNLIHLRALLICVVVLRTIDAKIPQERDLRTFQKRFSKIIKTEKLVREKEVLANGGGSYKRPIREDVKSLTVPERMPYIQKSDCYLVQDNLLKHFHMQEIFKKKYDLYSTTVLHGFAELQSVLFQMNGLNSLLNFPFSHPLMNQLFCGVFVYNLYDLLCDRIDMHFHVEYFIFRDSQMMFDFYGYLWDWCDPFIPTWLSEEMQKLKPAVNRKALKKQRQAARKQQHNVELADPNAEMVDRSSDGCADDDEFYDLNNKFCTFLKVSCK